MKPPQPASHNIENSVLTTLRAYEPLGTGRIKVTPDDFQVVEQMDWCFTGSGEHLYFWVQKSGLTTMDVIDALADYFQCAKKEIGYAGLKDKQALTTQWLSVKTNADSSEVAAFSKDGIVLLESHRHQRKLRQGQLKGNRFSIVVHHNGIDIDALSGRFEQLQQQGFPNYFDEQRFGFQQRNLNKAVGLLHQQRYRELTRRNGMYLSVLRSFLFNLVLNERVRQGAWSHFVPGDVMQLQGTHSVFASAPDDVSIASRVITGDIAPVGPLWGSHRVCPCDQAFAMEQTALQDQHDLITAFSTLRVKAGYRVFCAKPINLTLSDVEPKAFRLQFELGPGQYATQLIRQLVDITVA